MHSWKKLNSSSPDISAFGRDRLDGKVAYLGTIRTNGKPRVHPVTAILSDDHCFIFADPESSKVRDFAGNPQFSIHCGMSDSSGSSGEFQMTGRVVEVQSAEMRAEAERNCTFRPAARSILYELRIEEAVATSYRGGRPDRRRWRYEDVETA